MKKSKNEILNILNETFLPIVTDLIVIDTPRTTLTPDPVASGVYGMISFYLQLDSSGFGKLPKDLSIFKHEFDDPRIFVCFLLLLYETQSVQVIDWVKSNANPEEGEGQSITISDIEKPLLLIFESTFEQDLKDAAFKAFGKVTKTFFSYEAPIEE